MLVVRSQDGEMPMLIVGNFIYYIHYRSKENDDFEIIEETAEIRMKEKINVDDRFYSGDYVTLATYSSYKKALKVLDMLEAFVNTDYEKLQNLGYKNGKDIPITFVDFNSLHKPLDGVFRFPQDDEVEV